MQHLLKEQGNKLSKVELNNWLSVLLGAGLVRKSPKRGKPTIIPYKKRYTFDLWKLTYKGKEIGHKLEVFRGPSPIQKVEKIEEKVIEKKIKVPIIPKLEETSIEKEELLQNLSINLTLLKNLQEGKKIDLKKLSKITGLTPEKILEFIKDSEKRSSHLYYLNENPIDLRKKILQAIGLNPKKDVLITLSPKGKEIKSKLSP